MKSIYNLAAYFSLLQMADRIIPSCLNCVVKECLVSQYCSPEWQKLSDHYKTVVPYKKGQLIIKGDTEAFGIYIIYSGKVIVSLERDNRKRQIIRLASEGDILEYIQEHSKIFNPFSAEALESCTVCYIPKDMVLQMFSKDAELAYHLERDYAHKYIEVEKRFTNAMVMSSREKIADALLVVAEAFNGRIPLLRKELSEMIGLSTGHVGREIRKLVSEGIIELSGYNNEVTITDVERLSEIVSHYRNTSQLGAKNAKKQKMD